MRRVQLQLAHLGIYILCVLYAWYRGSATRMPHRVARIMVVPAGQIGDVVCTTPVLRALRRAYPEAHLVVDEGTGTNRALLAHSGLVDEYISFIGFVATMRALRAARPDVAVLTGAHFFALACLYLSGTPLISTPLAEGGVCPQETRLYRRLALLVTTRPYRFGYYAPQERLGLLEPFGIISSDTHKHLGFSPEAREKIGGVLSKEGLPEGARFVCISVGAGNKIKQWPPERFATVVAHLHSQYGLRTVLVGTQGEQEESAVMKALLPADTLVTDLSEQLSLDELKALIARAFLFISVDTGPLYIAEAFGVATLDIVGPMDEREQPPSGPRHRLVLPAYPRIPQLHILNARIYNEEEARRQVLSIGTGAVLTALDTLILSLS